VRLGIDFGTSRTVVAWCDRGNYPVVGFTDSAGDLVEFFPSVVAERKGEFVYGLDAVERGHEPDWTMVRSFKRILSSERVCSDTLVVVGSTQLLLSDLLRDFLRALRSALIQRSTLAGSIDDDQAIEAVIAAPANAHGAQRFLTLDAFRAAGFDVVALLNEPSAAGFEYAHRYRATLSSKRDLVAVYDLGGGTFDTSLVRMGGMNHDVVATAGLARLGGDDFDDLLVAEVLDRVRLSPEKLEKRALHSLQEQCRDQKERLNPSSKRLTLDLASSLGPQAPAPELTIELAQYYERCRPLIERTLAATESLLKPSKDRGESANGGLEADDPADARSVDLGDSEVAGLYVVGGASALPIIGRMLRERYGRRVHRSPYPSAAAAIGLAIYADRESNARLTDRLSRVFGVFRESDDGSMVSFDPIFARDTRLPLDGDATTIAERTYRAAHNVGHFRYVECHDVDFAGNPRGDLVSFGEVLFPFDPTLHAVGADLSAARVQRMGMAGPLIRERYVVDAHGIVEVKIANLDGAYELAYRIGAGPTWS
jgi:molecular chaperone DnaK (HSP70)